MRPLQLTLEKEEMERLDCGHGEKENSEIIAAEDVWHILTSIIIFPRCTGNLIIVLVTASIHVRYSFIYLVTFGTTILFSDDKQEKSL